MNRFMLFAAVAALAVALVGGAILLTSGRNGPSIPPKSTPTIVPTAVAAPLPNGLIARWFGGTRTLPGLEAGAGTTLLFREAVVSSGVLSVTQANQQNDGLLGSYASLVNGRIEVHDGNGPAKCGATQSGSYAYALSTSGETLTISDAQDPCAVRESTLTGTWWKVDCKNGQTICLGAMDAGTYGSQYVRPRLGGRPWAPKYGGLTFTVPEGWASDSDWPTSFAIDRLTDFAASATGEGPARIMVTTQVQAAAQGVDRCTSTAAKGVASTAEAIVSYLQGVRGLVVSAPKQLTVDGRAATQIDLTVDPATLAPCADSGEQLVEFMLYGGEGYAVGLGGIDRVIFVDLGNGDVVAINIEARDQATLDAFVGDAMPIVESFHFE